GEILIFDMRLVRPVAVLSTNDDGAIDWAVRPSTPFQPGQVALEKVTVTEGQVLVKHAASGREHRLTEINAELSATALTGPWRIDGSMRFDGMRTALQVSTGTLSPEGRLRLRVRAQPERYALDLESDGDVQLDRSAARYDGTFRLSERLPAPAPGSTSTRAPSYRVAGSFAVDHRGLDVSEFRMETGALDDPYRAEGHARLSFGAQPEFEIVADGAQVRLTDGQGQDGAGTLSLQQRLSAVHTALLGLPQPQIPGRVEVRLPALVTGDTTVRDIRLSAQPTDGGWAVEALSAALPGRTTLEGSGKLTSTVESFGFRGKLLLAVGQPSGFAAWLSRDVDESIRRLPAAGFSADVDLTARRQSLENLELILGDARFRGKALATLPMHAAPAMQVELEGGRLDVAGLSAFVSLFVSDQGVTRLAERDLDLTVKAGPVELAGITAATVDTAVRLRGGTLEVDRLQIGGIEGADISATATLKDLSGPLSGSIDASLVAGDAGPLVSLLAQRLPQVPGLAGLAARSTVYPGLLADTEIGAVVGLQPSAGGDRALSVSAQGDAGGSRFGLTLSGTGDL
ncbi:AsmA family protein, partial [Sphingomonas sp.]|uniref:AsmA family protein n=1 Tax=Sphingomonas sp. TaxID=28214 RepID=UPI003B3BCA59